MEHSVNYFHRLHQAFFTFNISQVQFRDTRTDVYKKRRPFLPRILFSSTVLSSTMSRSLVPSFTKIRQANVDSTDRYLFTPLRKAWFYCTNMKQTLNHSINSCRCLLDRIFSKSKNVQNRDKISSILISEV
jgi:hypothetical protein